jgi:hypothetical protein
MDLFVTLILRDFHGLVILRRTINVSKLRRAKKSSLHRVPRAKSNPKEDGGDEFIILHRTKFAKDFCNALF